MPEVLAVRARPHRQNVRGTEGSPVHPFTAEELEAFRHEVARKIVGMRLGVPAVVILESMLPLSFASSQLLVMFAPFVETFMGQTEALRKLQVLLEDREQLRRLIQEIEALEEGSPRKGEEAKGEP